MNAERLIELYDKVAEAPDAIERLRRFVLHLAVRGKLVGQEPTDTQDKALFERVEGRTNERAALAAGWKSVPVGSVLEFRYGKGLKASERLDDGPVPVYGSNGIVGYTTEPLTQKPSVIVGRKGSAGALNLCNGPSWTTDVAYFVEAPACLDLGYLFLTLDALDLPALGKGVKPGLSRADAYELTIGVPPVTEQRRIVAKVEELMALLDRLEAARNARETTRDRLTTASLTRLTAPDTDPDAFPDHARFALDALPALTARPDQIKVLRQAILNLAVRGKLVEQDSEDEPAVDFLRRLEEEKKRLIDVGKIKKQSPVEALEKTPFSVPMSWEWARLGQLGVIGSSSRVHQKDWKKGGVPFYRAREIVKLSQDGYVKNELFISEDLFAKLSEKGFRPQANDLMITGVGTIGVPYVVQPDDRFYFKDASVLIFKNLFEVYIDYLKLVCCSPYWLDKIHESSMGTTVHTLTISRASKVPIPLPPLAEQRRIVAKVNELMAQLKQLEASLGADDTTSALLLEALLREALGASSSQREPA